MRPIKTRRARRPVFRRGRVRGQRGSTLVELMIATAIMGTSVVALVTGTGTLFGTSTINRQAATAGIVARDYAEALSAAVSQTTSWCSTTYTVTYTPPTGYTVGAAYGACPANNASTVQIQTVTITATAPSGATETVKTIVRAP
jgi:type II secretory pathway pseudopilin PulG